VTVNWRVHREVWSILFSKGTELLSKHIFPSSTFATYQMNDILRYKQKSSSVDIERCLILQVIGPMKASVGPQVPRCWLWNYSWDGHPLVSSQGLRDRTSSWVDVNEKSGRLKLPTLAGYVRQLAWTEWGSNNPTKDWPSKLVVSEH
jgi:hypothetical protein